MTRMQLPLALLGLLLPMLASCSSPPGRYQQAAIHNRDGVPCFGVPDTKETRANPPLITAISVTEIGRGSEPVWERVFLRPGSTEPALHPNQCLTYGQDGAPAPAPPLRSGKRYQVVISGGTPGEPGQEQARVFIVCFYMVEAADRSAMRVVLSNFSTALSAGPPPVRMEDK